MHEQEYLRENQCANVPGLVSHHNPDGIQGCNVVAIENGYVISVQGWLDGNYYNKAYYAVDATALGKRIETIYADT